MTKAIMIDADTQNDLMRREGALYVPEAEDILPRVADLMDYASDFRIPVISTMLVHKADDPEVQRFGPHCMKGTWGGKKIDGTLLDDRTHLPLDWEPPLPDDIFEHQQIVIEKRQFDPFEEPAMHEVIVAMNKPRCLVFGVPTEHSVRQICLGLVRHGCRVALILNATRSMREAAGRDAIEEIKAKGVEFITTAEVLRVAV